MDATGLAVAIRQKDLSAKEAVLAAIDRIEAENPRLNAITSKRYEKALAEAERIDLQKPFAGVPILLKDLGQEQAGEIATNGSRLFRQSKSLHHDNYVKKVLDLGFIVLGRTNTPEFGFKNISDSQLHGSVNLPYDVSRNAGGSSGGAAAAVASGMVPLAGASDGGGSIRIPASFNSLIGLKPSRGRLPVGPDSYRGWQGASSHFFLTKSVRDTSLLLAYTQVCQMESPFPLPLLPQEAFLEKPSRPLKIAVRTASPIGGEVDEEAVLAVDRLAKVLEEFGHQVTYLEKEPISDPIRMFQGYYVMNSVETASMFDQIEGHLGRPLTPDDMELMTWVIYRSGQKIPAKQYSQVLQDWDRYSASMAAFHQQYDLWLTPSTAGPAPKHGAFTPSPSLRETLTAIDSFSSVEQQSLIWEMFVKPLELTPYNAIANLTGQPAISLPTHLTADGLPIGVQFIAAKGREDLLLALAASLEAAGLFHTGLGKGKR